MIELDHSVFHFFNSWMENGRHFWSLWVSSTLGVLIAAFVIGGAVWTRRPVAALLALLAFGITDPTSSYLLKPMFGRDRPCAAMTGVLVPATPKGEGICGSGPAMPSNHAGNTMAVAVATNNPVLVIVSLFVGLSRVVTGQHWPSDVLVGWTFGGLVGWVVRTLAEKVIK
jgi:undecaprenyl-diphosphatase